MSVEKIKAYSNYRKINLKYVLRLKNIHKLCTQNVVITKKQHIYVP